jgi:hypothetical protein
MNGKSKQNNNQNQPNNQTNNVRHKQTKQQSRNKTLWLKTQNNTTNKPKRNK